MTSADDRRRWSALVVVLFAQLMMVLDVSIVNVALPAIQRDLGFRDASLAWVVDAYLIVFGGFLLVAGRLGDLVGRREVLLGGLGLFTAASALCGLSTDPALLVAARAVQGLGAALASAVILAIVATEFTSTAERARAMSLYMLVSVSGGSLGLLAGGVLTDWLSWHWIFFVNLPIGAATMIGVWRLVERREGLGLSQGVDVQGAVLATVAVMLGVFAIVQAPEQGWTSTRTLGVGAASALLLAAFLALEARLTNPILPLRVLRLRSLSGASVVRGLLASAMFGCWFLGALYLQRVLGYGTVKAGAAFLPMTLSVAAMSLGPTSYLVRRFGALPVLLAGVGVAAAGLMLVSRISADGSYLPTFGLAFAVMGLGFGTAMPPLLTLALEDVHPTDAGVASALINVSMYASGAVGLAALGAIAESHTRAVAGGGAAGLGALVDGYQLALEVSAGLAVVALLVAVTVLRAPRAQAPGRTVAPALPPR